MRGLRHALAAAVLAVAAAAAAVAGAGATRAPDAPPAAGALAGDALLRALRGGGHVVYFRHAATDFAMADADAPAPANCRRLRNLDAPGRAGARAIGRAWRSLGIRVGRVLSSRYCRARDTARLASTAQHADALGRLDPRTGRLRVVRAPGGFGPYGIATTPGGGVWLTDFAANALVRFDPRTARFTTVWLPGPRAAVRQLLGRRGEVWGAESGTDKLVVDRAAG